MAIRPAFFCNNNEFWKENFEFTWYPGFSYTQKQKSIEDFHLSIQNKYNDKRILEISTKSPDKLGVKLSAFNLSVKIKGKTYSVEQLFQSSKCFEKSGSMLKLLDRNYDSSKMKKYLKNIQKEEKLIVFQYFERYFPLEPKNFFYNWLYINALNQNNYLAEEMIKYDCFTDIEFNPTKSYSCQAEACSIYKYLYDSKLLDKAIETPESFETIVYIDTSYN